MWPASLLASRRLAHPCGSASDQLRSLDHRRHSREYKLSALEGNHARCLGAEGVVLVFSPEHALFGQDRPPVYRIILHRGLTILNLPALAQFLSKLDELNQK